MTWYSVRMRAAEGGPHEQGGTHISGGERIVGEDGIEAMVQSLLRRAMTHEKGRSDFINLTVERVPDQEIQSLTALPIRTHPVADLDEGRAAAVEWLADCGIDRRIAQQAVDLIASGPAPDGGAMRGAIVLDADTGERLEGDRARGVRISKIDWDPDALALWQDHVATQGLAANERIAEAVALATKVMSTPGTVAELCWSDDPGYVAGYVATQRLGYVRIPYLKALGSPLGGRVYFVRGVQDAAAYERELQVPALVKAMAPEPYIDGKESWPRHDDRLPDAQREE